MKFKGKPEMFLPRGTCLNFRVEISMNLLQAKIKSVYWYKKKKKIFTQRYLSMYKWIPSILSLQVVFD